jgi:hypothetical protein
MKGFSQHGSVRCGAPELKALEQLRRNITYPLLAHEKVQPNAAGWVLLKLTTPWWDGATHLVMARMKFMHRHIDGQLCGIEFCERYVR